MLYGLSLTWAIETESLNLLRLLFVRLVLPVDTTSLQYNNIITITERKKNIIIHTRGAGKLLFRTLCLDNTPPNTPSSMLAALL